MYRSTNKKQNICFIGASLNTGNMGVSALCASFVKIASELDPEKEVFLALGNKTSHPQTLRLCNKVIQLRVVNHRLSPKAKLREHLFWIFFLSFFIRVLPFRYLKRKIIKSTPFLYEMYQSEFVCDIFGGDSFSDIYGLSLLIFSTLPSFVAIFLGKKYILLPQTYGPFKSRIAKYIASFILNRAFRIYSRDREGIDYAKPFLNEKAICKNPIFCPDVAFMLDSLQPEKIDIQPTFEFDSSVPLIGLNVNGLMYNGGYSKDNMFDLKIDYRQLIEKLIKSLIQQTNARILLVPHTFGLPGNINSDPDASRAILKNLPDDAKSRVFMLTSQYDQSELKGIISRCDFFIGSRMHSCIAALSQGIPTIGIAYSKKFIGVFDSVGVGENVLDARELDEQSIISSIIEKFNIRDEVEENISKHVSTAKNRVMTVFKELLTDVSS